MLLLLLFEVLKLFLSHDVKLFLIQGLSGFLQIPPFHHFLRRINDRFSGAQSRKLVILTVFTTHVNIRLPFLEIISQIIWELPLDNQDPLKSFHNVNRFGLWDMVHSTEPSLVYSSCLWSVNPYFLKFHYELLKFFLDDKIDPIHILRQKIVHIPPAQVRAEVDHHWWSYRAFTLKSLEGSHGDPIKLRNFFEGEVHKHIFEE